MQRTVWPLLVWSVATFCHEKTRNQHFHVWFVTSTTKSISKWLISLWTSSRFHKFRSSISHYAYHPRKTTLFMMDLASIFASGLTVLLIYTNFLSLFAALLSILLSLSPLPSLSAMTLTRFSLTYFSASQPHLQSALPHATISLLLFTSVLFRSYRLLSWLLTLLLHSRFPTLSSYKPAYSTTAMYFSGLYSDTSSSYVSLLPPHLPRILHSFPLSLLRGNLTLMLCTISTSFSCMLLPFFTHTSVNLLLAHTAISTLTRVTTSL